MTLKRWLMTLLIATVFFLAGVAVGRFVMPRKINIMVINIKDLVEIIERYNETKYEFEKIKEWNENAITKPEPEKKEIGSNENK